MNQILLECAFNSDQEDGGCRKFDKFKNYFVKSFLMQVFGAFAPSTATTSCTRGVWRGLVPPRVKVLTWMTLLGKLNTKDRLRRFRIINEELHPFCDENLETVNHLFYHCYLDWKVWCSILNWWDLNQCYRESPKQLFEAWIDVNLRVSQRNYGVPYSL